MTIQSSTVKVLVKFMSDWHIGTGGGIPGISDQSLLRDAKGFPFIPGRTLQGILRETHREFALLPHFQVDYPYKIAEIWGTNQVSNSGESSNQSQWVISNGELDISTETRDALEKASNTVRSTWLNAVSFTASRISLNPRKRTKEDHLAFIELGRKGLVFKFTITSKNNNFSEMEMKLLRLLLLGTQRLGGFRRRGKGRVSMFLAEDSDIQTMHNKLKEKVNV